MRFHAYRQTQSLEHAPLGLGPLQTYLAPVRKRQPLYLGHLRNDDSQHPRQNPRHVVNANHRRRPRPNWPNANHRRRPNVKHEQRLPHRSPVVRL